MLSYIPYHAPSHPGRVFTTFVAMGAVIEALTRTGEYFTATRLDYTVQLVRRILCREAYFWCFEAIVITSNSLLLNLFHPSSSLPRANKIYLTLDGVSVDEGPGYKDARPFLATL